ncbi:class I SAM-dependent methyltransferase [Halocynthiibacter namhaensis]|uniref:class I SAM-dependent methyltransferase n=1 Tax=Halocynthiibacter namhaensis TaxID=1290553 RepID=UPI00057931E0|nr:class I SAM-dependent methyltransferase [Halocynthiibacter namhaensis]
MVDAEKFWDGVAASYVKGKIGDMSSYDMTLERAAAHLKPEDRVIELGCGTGMTARILAPGVKTYIASDISAEMFAQGQRTAREHPSNINFAKGDTSQVLGEQKDLNAVLAFNVLHLLKDPGDAIRAAHTALKPGGVFISKTQCNADGFQLFHGRTWVLRLMMWIALPVMQLVGKAPYVKLRSVQAQEALFTENGFEIIESGDYPAQPPRRFIVARRVSQKAR